MLSTNISNISHNCQDLIRLFNATFAQREGTQLVGGAHEPVYTPSAAAHACHRIVFTRDYFASALHEVAHWCVAGPARRQLADYGYWYAPDGRSEAEQSEFERVEVRPQALEWLFSVACAAPFRVSADNLAHNLGPSASFKQAIYRQVLTHCEQGVNPRVALFCETLLAFYRPGKTLHWLLRPANFTLEAL